MLYLDFDGVLHPEDVRVSRRSGPYVHSPSGRELFEHADLLVAMLEPYPRLKVVLSTSWAQHYGVRRAAARLPEALRERCIGGTVHSSVRRGRYAEIPRGRQVLNDVARRKPSQWLAIDDTDEGWSPESRANLVLSDPIDGIGHPRVRDDLSCKLRRFAGREGPVMPSQPSDDRHQEGASDRDVARRNLLVIECESQITEVVATVVAVVPELACADLDSGGWFMSIDDETTGIDWRSLAVGDRVRCVVQGRSTTKVLAAYRLEPSA